MNTIKDERIKLGLTQHQFAELLGIPFRTIQNWEGGQRKCPDYVEALILEKLEQIRHQNTLIFLLDMMQKDLPTFETDEAKEYIDKVCKMLEFVLEK